MTRRHHLSPKPEPFKIEPREQSPIPTMKPNGLWYEVDEDWRRWMEAEQWSPTTYSATFWLTLGDENMLLINSIFELDNFHDEYHVSQHIEKAFDGKPIDLGLGISWDRVAEKYDGIEIAPYMWERRLAPGFMWYYGWDCASGVIWRPRGAKLETDQQRQWRLRSEEEDRL